jgi:hypothetical protein
MCTYSPTLRANRPSSTATHLSCGLTARLGLPVLAGNWRDLGGRSGAESLQPDASFGRSNDQKCRSISEMNCIDYMNCTDAVGG